MTGTILDIGKQKFYVITEEAENTKANIILVHGYAEHIGRYQSIVKELSEMGLNVYGYDRRGEGKSSGKKAYINHMDDQVRDLYDIKSTMIANALPTFIFGHSLGGLIVTKYLLRYGSKDIRGVILSGALLKIDDDISPFLRKIAPLVSAIAPRYTTDKLTPYLLSRTPEIVASYITDPLVYHGGTYARTGYQMIKSTAEVQANFPKITVPILITHGSKDKLADPKGSELMYRDISSTDKTLKIYDGLYHEILNEPEKVMVRGVMMEWIRERM